MLRIAISQEEVSAQAASQETIDEATKLFNANGYLVLDNVVSVDLIKQSYDAYLKRYQRYLENRDHQDALTVGDKRFMVTVELRPPFTEQSLYANPYVMPIIRRLLGANCILGSFGSVVSLPGSDRQHIHRDFPGLYETEGLDPILPPFAITMIIPLISMNDQHGTTLVWEGSHRQADSNIKETDYMFPDVPAGSCLLMDYRLVHGGSANNSDTPRPILYSVYYRPWFRDYANYSKQSSLSVTDEFLDSVSDTDGHLFMHKRHNI